MKASVNTMDLRIATAMREAANVVFNAMPKTQDVNITSMQVYQHFTDARINIPGMPKDSEFLANIPASNGLGWSINEDHVITISIDTFSCKCEGVMIFKHLHTFERIASAKDKARFVYAMPKSNSANTFTVNVEKSAIDILKNVDNNELRRVMCSVYIDFRRANLVASNGRTLQIMKCALSGDVPSVDGVVIPANIAKRVLKDREFTVTIDGTHIICGNECFNEIGRYPAYLSVWNKYESAEDEFINLAPKAWKEIQSQAKRAIKSSNNAVFVFHALSGEGVITIDVWDKYERAKINEFKVFTKNTVPVSFAFAWNAITVMRFKDVESIQGLNNDSGITLFGANYIGLAMPVCMDFCDANYIVLPYEDKKRNYDPVSAYREMINTAPVESMEETANTIPVETMEETANTIPVETMEETANTIPVESMEETANTVPVETMEETANTVPVETIEETANTIPVETMEETANTIPVETMEETANTVPVETMEETANTVPVETIEETANTIPVDAYKIERETANTIPVETMEETANTVPVETMEETANTIPVETMEEDRPEKAFMAFIWAMVAACIMAVLVLTGTRPHIALQAANTIPVETMEETANTIPVETMEETANTIPVVTIEAAINDVICTGSFDRYYNKVKEEIITNYRDIMKSQLYELAELASVDDSEVFAALETSETDPETPESVPTVENIEDTENTPESVEIMPTETDTETDAGTVSDNTEIDYNSSEYVELSVITTDANGNQVVNIYTVPLNE